MRERPSTSFCGTWLWRGFGVPCWPGPSSVKHSIKDPGETAAEQVLLESLIFWSPSRLWEEVSGESTARSGSCQKAHPSAPPLLHSSTQPCIHYHASPACLALLILVATWASRHPPNAPLVYGYGEPSVVMTRVSSTSAYPDQ